MATPTAALLELFPEPAAIVSSDGNLVSVNKAFAAWFDTTADRLEGRSLLALPGIPGPAFRDILERCCRTSGSLPFAAELRNAKGDLIRCRVQGAVVTRGDSTGSTTVCLRLTAQDLATDGFHRLNEEVSALKREIKARNQAEQALGLSEARYRDLIHALPAAVYTCDAQGRVTLYNQAAAVLWGREPEIGKDLWCGSWKLYRPDGRPLPLDECPMTVTLREGRAVHGEEIIIERPDGTRRHMRPHPEPIVNEAGIVVGAVDMLIDVTETKQAEEALARLAAIVTSSDDAIVSKNLDGIVMSWNRAAERLFGYTADEMIGQPISRLIPEERHNEEPAILERLRRGEAITHYETIRCKKDGTRLHISLSVSPMVNAHGKIIGASKIARDITAQKLAEQALLHSREELRRALEYQQAVVSNMGEGLYTVDGQGLVTSVNQAAERLFGWTRQEMLGRKMHDMVHYKRPDGTAFPAAECAGLHVLRDGAPLINFEDVFIRKDGSFFDVVYSSSPIWTGGKISGLVVVFRDVSDRKRIDAALRDRDRALTVANEALTKHTVALAEANKELESFSYSVSHDLRAPLRTIDAFSRIVEEDHGAALDPEAQRCLAVVRKAAGQAGELIDDLLELSRLGRQSMQFQPVDMVQLAREAAEEAGHCHPDRKVEVFLGDLPPCEGDRRLLKLVWANLLSNAFKYTQYSSGPKIEVGWLPDDAQPAVAVYYVKDNGVGFDMRYVNKLFGVFQRLHKKEEYEGTGVGLAIVHRIVHRHAGRVWAEGKVNGGATFYFCDKKGRGRERVSR